MLIFLRVVIVLFCFNSAFANTSFKDESFLEFTNAVSENVAKTSSNVSQDIDYISIYENNLLSVEQRYLFYKRIISLQEIKNWAPNLKNIVLIKFVDYDLHNTTPAYLKFNQGKSVFMDMINQFMKEEFSFLEEMKANIIEEARSKGEDVDRVEFDESQMNDIIYMVYNKLVVESNKNYLFIK